MKLSILILVAMTIEETSLIKQFSGTITPVTVDARTNVTLHKIEDGNNTIYISKVGVGLVNAAIRTNSILNNIHVDQIYVSGLAGALDERLKLGDIIISEQVLQHDSVYSSDKALKPIRPGAELSRGQNPDPFFISPSNLVAQTYSLTTSILSSPQVAYKGILLSGSEFMCSTERKKALKIRFPDALAVDMEASAVFQTAASFNVPVVAIKTVSDTVSPQTDSIFKDFVSFLEWTSEHSASILSSLIKRI